MGFLDNLLGRAKNTVRNDVVKPFQRDVAPALHQLLNVGASPQPSPAQAPAQPPANQHNVNPVQPNDQAGKVNQSFNLPIWSPTASPVGSPLGFAPPDKQLQPSIDRAKAQFQWTPAFNDLVLKAQPQLSNKLDSRALQNVKAAGTYQSNNGSGLPFNQYINPQTISVNPKYQNPLVLTHEGLHAAYANSPTTRKDFANAYNNSITPEVANYLSNRTKVYAAANGHADFSNLSKVAPSLQNEAHSYLSEYPAATGNALPPGLANYYSRYLNTNAPQQTYQVFDSLQSLLHPQNYSSYGGDY